MFKMLQTQHNSPAPETPVTFVLSVVAKELRNDFRNLKALVRACPRKDAVDIVYRIGLMAEFRGRTNTAIQANT